MRIATVVHSGVKHDARVLKGAATLKAQGHDVRLFGLTPDESEEFVLPNGVPVYLRHRDLSDIRPRVERESLPKGRESSIWTSFRIQGETLFDIVSATFRPHVVYIHDHVALTASALYKEAFGAPVVWDAHEIYEELAHSDADRSAVNVRIIEENAASLDGFITLNESMAKFYRCKYPGLPSPVLIPNATSRTSRPGYDNRLHEAAGLKTDQNIALFQGVYALHRGIEALLESSQYLKDHWTIVFMGWGHHEEDILRYAEAESDRPEGRARVAMVPGVPHNELLSWTAGASVGLIPYEDTGLNHLYCSPNKLWEYPAAGVPILATDLPEMEKHISKHEIGVNVPRVLDPEEIAATINGLTGEKLEILRRNCALHANTEHWENYESSLIDLFSTLGRMAGIASSPMDMLSPKLLWSKVSRWLRKSQAVR